MTEGVRGLYAASLGGDAYWYSDDGSDPGGKGGVGGIIQLTHTGAISVIYNDLSAPNYPYGVPAIPTSDNPSPPGRVSSDRSAGIYLLSVGGEGGGVPLRPRRLAVGALGVEPHEKLVEVRADREPFERLRIERPRREQDRERDEPHRPRVQ